MSREFLVFVGILFLLAFFKTYFSNRKKKDSKPQDHWRKYKKPKNTNS